MRFMVSNAFKNIYWADKGDTRFVGLDDHGRAILQYVSSWRSKFKKEGVGKPYPLQIHLNREALLIRKYVRRDLGLDVTQEICALIHVIDQDKYWDL